MQQILTLNDDAHRTPPALPPETIYNILNVNEKEVQGIQLTPCEVAGFVAEMQPDAEGFVAYGEHIKKWVPIIFEHRKNQLLFRYLQPDCYETLSIPPPDLAKLDAMFPLFPADAMPKPKGGSGRRSSRVRRDSFMGLAGSLISNAPSHSRADSKARDSKGHTVQSRRTSLQAFTGYCGQGMAGAALRRLSSKQKAEEPVTKEPPPGRGYERRKARLAALAELAKTEDPHADWHVCKPVA